MIIWDVAMAGPIKAEEAIWCMVRAPDCGSNNESLVDRVHFVVIDEAEMEKELDLELELELEFEPELAPESKMEFKLGSDPNANRDGDDEKDRDGSPEGD
eukprot:TRINITY_DN4059_c0_g1_i2.p2 TRINITY_DN4059_c0_g1~~TRINITY_DN4059_c0_g1_i2.p2  ORF type:complete len:100 (-),score=17.40 TRINITY_DN4059_c0_g1_i2:314-613(-)